MTPFAYYDERRPLGRMGIVITGSDQGQHGASQRFRATELGISFDLIEGLSDELDSGIRIYRPVRDEQRACSGVEECAGEAGERLRVGLVTCTASGIARREHHPVRVELELRDLGGREKAVILFRRSCGRSQK